MEIYTEVFGVNVTCNAGVGARVTFAPKLFRSRLFRACPGTERSAFFCMTLSSLLGTLGRRR